MSKSKKPKRGVAAHQPSGEFKPLPLKGLPEGKAQFDAEGFKGKKK
jgi:hypothetical protein